MWTYESYTSLLKTRHSQPFIVINYVSTRDVILYKTQWIASLKKLTIPLNPGTNNYNKRHQKNCTCKRSFEFFKGTVNLQKNNKRPAPSKIKVYINFILVNLTIYFFNRYSTVSYKSVSKSVTSWYFASSYFIVWEVCFKFLSDD